jgi:hypothetical protein
LVNKNILSETTELFSLLGRSFDEDDGEGARHDLAADDARLQGLRQRGRNFSHRRPDRPQPLAHHRRGRVHRLPAE